MNDLELIPKIQKFLKTNVDNIAAAMIAGGIDNMEKYKYCLLYTSPSPRDYAASRMPSSA